MTEGYLLSNPYSHVCNIEVLACKTLKTSTR